MRLHATAKKMSSLRTGIEFSGGPVIITSRSTSARSRDLSASDSAKPTARAISSRTYESWYELQISTMAERLRKLHPPLPIMSGHSSQRAWPSVMAAGLYTVPGLKTCPVIGHV